MSTDVPGTNGLDGISPDVVHNHLATVVEIFGWPATLQSTVKPHFRGRCRHSRGCDELDRFDPNYREGRHRG